MRLIAQNTELDLRQGTSFTFEYASPLFKQQVEAEAYTYPVNLPNSPVNRQFFKYLHQAQSRAKFLETDCLLQHQSQEILRGRLWLMNAGAESFTVSILKNAWDTDVLETSIKNLNYGGRRTVGDMRTHALWTVNQSVETADYVFFPILNEDFYPDATNFKGIINDWDTVNQRFFPNAEFDPSENGFDTFLPYANTLVPCVYLVYVLKQVAKAFGKQLTGDFALDAEIKTLVIYNTFALDEIRDTGFGFLSNIYKESIDIVQHLPNITIAQLLNALIGQFNLAVQITDTDLSINFKNAFLTQSALADISDLVQRYPTVEPFLTQQGYAFQSQTDTNDKLWETLREAQLQQGNIGEPVPYRTNLPTSTVPNQTHFVTYYNAWYRAASIGTFKLDYRRIEDTGYAPNFYVGQAKQTIQNNASTLVMRKHLYGEVEGSPGHLPLIASCPLLPAAKQQGNSPQSDFFKENTDNPFSLRLLFYRGLQPNWEEALYPLASSDIYNVFSANQGPIAKRGLTWEHTYNTCYKAWLALIDNAKALNMQVHLDAFDWAQWNMTAKYRWQNQHILPERMSVTFTEAGPKTANLRALKL